MKKLIVALCLAVCMTFSISAQKEKGFGGKLMAGYGINAGSSFNTFNVNLMPGYHFNSSWFAGVGVGYENVNLSVIDGKDYNSMSVIPIFAHAQWNFIEDAPIIPFLGLRLGYGIGSKNISEGIDLNTRMLTVAEIGAKYSFGAAAIFATVSYEYLDTDISMPTGKESTKLSISSYNQTIGINLGVEF